MRTMTAKPIKELVGEYQPSKPSETPQAPEAVCELWAVMAEIFGSRWTSQQPPTPTDGWIMTLADLSAADIGTGIWMLRESGREWPPTATEFRKWCKPPKRENEAMYHRPPDRQLPHKLDDARRAKGREAIAEAKKLCQ